MKYQFYQTRDDLLHPVREAARFGAAWVRAWDLGCLTPPLFRAIGAASEIFAEAHLTHRRPDYGITAAPVGNRTAAIAEEAADDTPFGTLLHFRKDLTVEQPRVLLVAPMSGHFATLLRQTVRTMLTHLGDTSNLILDPDLDTYYLMDVSLIAFPNAEERLAATQYLGEALLAKTGESDSGERTECPSGM